MPGRDWATELPVLANDFVTLRELELEDAPALVRHLARPAVGRYTTPPPSTVDGFERHIRWAIRERQASRHASFAIVPRDAGEPVGVIQLWTLCAASGVMEWGGVLDDRFWQGSVFSNSARLMIDYAFEALGATRLEARVHVDNDAGHALMRRLGATRELVLRNCLKVQGVYGDHALWAILRDEWRAGAR